jgi:hypothetical protein
MPDRSAPPHEKPIDERRTPLDNDVDPDGMDSDTEGDELEAGHDDDSDADDLADGPDGAVDRRKAGQGRTSGTHGSARPDTAPRGSGR